jgi:flavodoxin
MKRVLVAYSSVSGTTQKMAEYIAEGVRFSRQSVEVKKIEEINMPGEVIGYDGYIFGSPTYSLDIPPSVLTFLNMIEKSDMEGKMCGTFGSYTHDVSYKHDNYAPAMILDILQQKFKMRPFELGPFSLKQDLIDTNEGMKNCHDYGRFFGQKVSESE